MLVDGADELLSEPPANAPTPALSAAFLAAALAAALDATVGAAFSAADVPTFSAVFATVSAADVPTFSAADVTPLEKSFVPSLAPTLPKGPAAAIAAVSIAASVAAPA